MANIFRISLLTVTTLVSFVSIARGTTNVDDDMTINEMKVLLRKQSKQLMELEKKFELCSKRTCKNDFQGEVKNENQEIEKSKLVIIFVGFFVKPKNM